MLPIIRYFSKLRRFTQLDDRKRVEYLYRPHSTFIRNSPLTFSRTVSFIIDLARQSLAVELARFFKYDPERVVTKSAFCQRRKAIKPAFFRDLFDRTHRYFYNVFKKHQRWKGKRLIAVDGTGQKLPNQQKLGEAFGFHLNQHDNRPSTRLLLTHDVLNNIILDVNLHTQKSAEIIHAYQNVAGLATDGIYIYDRGFESYGLAYLHHRAGCDYVIRMSLTGTKEVVEFLKSGDKDRIVEVKAKGRTKSTIRKLGIELPRQTVFRVRLVRVELSTGETEVLMTSLLDRDKYPAEDFLWLYGKRWGVETGIYVLKSFLQIALFSAYTQPGVEQDLWATMAFYNQQSALVAAPRK